MSALCRGRVPCYGDILGCRGHDFLDGFGFALRLEGIGMGVDVLVAEAPVLKVVRIAEEHSRVLVLERDISRCSRIQSAGPTSSKVSWRRRPRQEAQTPMAVAIASAVWWREMSGAGLRRKAPLRYVLQKNHRDRRRRSVSRKGRGQERIGLWLWRRIEGCAAVACQLRGNS